MRALVVWNARIRARSANANANANAAAWTELSRAGFDVLRDYVNTPAFFRLLPPVAGLAVDEPHADEQTATVHPRVADTRIVPLLLLIRAGKRR